MNKFTNGPSLLFALIMFAFSLQAFAAPVWRVKSCDFDVHGTEISDIYRDGYFQGNLEMKKISATDFRAETLLFSGYVLRIEARISGRRLSIRSQLRFSDQTVLPVFRDFNLPSQIPSQVADMTFPLSAQGPSSHSVDPSPTQFLTLFDRQSISCHVGPETLSERIFDWVD